MKKYIFAIASICMIAAVCLTGCNKNEDVPEEPKEDPTPTPVLEEDLYFYAPATVEELKYVDVTYTLSVDGETKELQLSKLSELKDADRFAKTSKLLYKVYNGVDPSERSEAKIFEYHIGKVKNARIVSVKYTYSVAKTDHKIDGFIGGAIMTAEGVGKQFFDDVEYYTGLDDLSGFFDTLNAI